MAQKKNKQDQSLVEYLTRLKQLNDIDVKLPNINIEKILNDPKQYALNFKEAMFIKYLKQFIDAYKLGDDFSKKLLKNGKKI